MYRMLLLLTTICVTACSGPSEKETMLAKVNALEKELKESTSMRIDLAKGKEMIAAYRTFADKFTQDSLAPEYLFKAGEIAMGIQDHDVALSYFQRINKHFRDFRKAPESLFLIGFIYDTYLDQQGKAKEIYEQVLEEYPEHHLADDAKASIQHLGMSDEDLIKMFKRKELEAKGDTTTQLQIKDNS